MKKLTFILLLLTKISTSQLTSFGLSYGIGGVNDLSMKLKFPSHQAHLDFNIYIAKNFSIGFNLYYQSSKINQLTNDSIPVSNYNSMGVGFNLKYWFLNDFRLKKKKGSKGKITALTYPFRMYLLANAGYGINLSKNPNLQKGSFYAGGGLGANIWQLYPKKKNGVGAGTSKYFFIPFIEIIYDHFFSDYLKINTQKWNPSLLNFKFGFKIAFDKY